jgi:hypothetical protein
MKQQPKRDEGSRPAAQQLCCTKTIRPRRSGGSRKFTKSRSFQLCRLFARCLFELGCPASVSCCRCLSLRRLLKRRLEDIADMICIRVLWCQRTFFRGRAWQGGYELQTIRKLDIALPADTLTTDGLLLCAETCPTELVLTLAIRPRRMTHRSKDFRSMNSAQGIVRLPCEHSCCSTKPLGWLRCGQR